MRGFSVLSVAFLSITSAMSMNRGNALMVSTHPPHALMRSDFKTELSKEVRMWVPWIARVSTVSFLILYVPSAFPGGSAFTFPMRMGVLNSIVLMMMFTTGITEGFGTRIGLGAGVNSAGEKIGHGIGTGINSAGEKIGKGIGNGIASAGRNLMLGRLGSAALIGGVYLITQYQPKKS